MRNHLEGVLVIITFHYIHLADAFVQSYLQLVHSNSPELFITVKVLVHLRRHN